MKGILDTKTSSGYDDDIGVRYEFPPVYQPIMRRFVGDWIIYREPRRNRGRQAYIGIAQVQEVIPDPDRAGKIYAYVSNFVPFDVIVPFGNDGSYWEGPLQGLDPKRVGAAVQGKSVRPISEVDFAAILSAGFPGQLPELGGTTPPSEIPPVTERVIATMVVRKKLRDAQFRVRVCQAYSDTCAFSGIRLYDRSGNPEAQAAHIKSVALGGPDTLQNGLALSATFHWLFDRHLATVGPERQIILADRRIPLNIRPLLQGVNGKIIGPVNDDDGPHESFLSFHRSTFERLERGVD